MKTPKTQNLRYVEKVLAITIFEGEGTNESKAREVKYIYSFDGDFIAVIDPAPESEANVDQMIKDLERYGCPKDKSESIAIGLVVEIGWRK